MKNKGRYLLAISAFFFWICMTTVSMPVVAIFSAFGLGVGFLIAKAKPLSELSWPAGIRKALFFLLSAVLSVIVCVRTAQIFHNSWGTSVLLKSALTRFIANYSRGLITLEVLLALGMFPSVFDVLCRALFHAWNILRSIRWAFLWKYALKAVTVKTSIKNVILTAVTLLLCACLGIGLLTAVYCIPTDPIDQNVAQSALTIQKEGIYYSISNWFFSRLDNWTDSIILMEAAIREDTSALKAAVNAVHGAPDNTSTPTDALLAHYFDGKPYDTLIEYCRYWHGYLILIKPLLCFMDYSSIRILNGAVQLILVAAICLLMHKKGLKEYIVPFLLMYFMLMPVALAASLQFSTCFYVIILGVIATLLIKQEKLDQFSNLLFLLIGISTAYFDFLTYPMATFGIPILFVLLRQTSRPLEEKLFLIVKCGIFWCVGFAGMWASKWVISHYVCGYSYSRIMAIIADRTDASASASIFHIEALNYTTFLTTPISVLVLLFIGIKYSKIRKGAVMDQQEAYRSISPYILVACAPIVWYAFASDHSLVHYWFTHKSCVVTLLGILFAVTGVQASPKNSSCNS